jgi:1,4-dihydroxy-2-naphthoate octaprenyltransferase
VRFLLASIIAVGNGIAISYWKTGHVDPLNAALTFGGVMCLHASVDLLNDYWDYRRGIDQLTTRTKFSGGTGVLPEKILSPRSVYLAGVAFLVLGVLVGAYFVIIRGPLVAIILAFAVVSIYFYSSSIVNAGLGELFVGIKGALIVIGSYFVQTGHVEPVSVFVGAIIGLLSSTVLFMNSIPDASADKAKGRRTLVILVGTQRATLSLPLFFILVYVLITAGVLLGIMKPSSVVALASSPIAILAIKRLRQARIGDAATLEPAMASTIAFSRLTGVLLAASFLI